MMLIGRITVTTEMSEDGEFLHKVDTEDGAGEELGLMESLGMLEMAKDSLLKIPPGSVDPDDVDEDDHG